CGYVMRKNKELLGFVWKPMVRMRMNGSIISGNYCVSGITRESKVTDESITLAGLVSLYQPSDDLCELLTSSFGVIVGKRVETENGSSRATLMAMKTMLENVVGSIKRNQLEDLFVVQLEVIMKAEYRQSHAKVRKNILLKIPLCAIGTTLHDYVHMAAKATGEFMVKIEQVFDLRGKQVFDLWSFRNELVFSKQELAMNWKSRVAAFVASHVLVKKSSLQKECDIEFIRNLDGNKDIICLNENIDIMGSHFWKSDVVELMVSKINPEITRLVATASEVTKFAIPKKLVREAFEKLLGSKLVSDTQIKSIVEPMSVISKDEWKKQGSSDKKIVSVAQLTEREARVKVLLLEVASGVRKGDDVSIRNSDSNQRIQRTSLTVEAMALYSAFDEDRDTTDCFLLFQEIGVPPSKRKYPVRHDLLLPDGFFLDLPQTGSGR
nr:hypothetical protein [Tanacetum cinerariifolium]